MQAVIDAYVVLPGKGDPLPLTMARKKRYVQLVSTCMEEDAGAPPAEFKAAFAHFPAEVQEELQSIEDEMKPPLVAWWRLVGSTAAELALKQKREAAKREAAELKKRNTQSLKPAEEPPEPTKRAQAAKAIQGRFRGRKSGGEAAADDGGGAVGKKGKPKKGKRSGLLGGAKDGLGFDAEDSAAIADNLLPSESDTNTATLAEQLDNLAPQGFMLTVVTLEIQDVSVRLLRAVDDAELLQFAVAGLGVRQRTVRPRTLRRPPARAPGPSRLRALTLV